MTVITKDQGKKTVFNNLYEVNVKHDPTAEKKKKFIST
jgi:hypothetical protein